MASTVTSRGVGSQTYFEVLDFLNTEAELLDDNKIREWFALLDPEIDYKVPIRVTRFGMFPLSHVIPYDWKITDASVDPRPVPSSPTSPRK